jgi:predicted Fe-Mo cluster-binding NifX family protein
MLETGITGATMNVAIPLFGSRISPRFDFCQEILIVTIEQGIIVDRKVISISSLTPFQRISELCNRDVKTVICGGVSTMVHNHLRNNGISVIYDVMGEADEALKRYLAGGLQPRAFCERRRGRGFRKRDRPWSVFSGTGRGSVGSEAEEEKK